MIYTDEETFVCVDDKVAAKFGNFQTPLNGFSIGIDVFKKVDKFCKLTQTNFERNAKTISGFKHFSPQIRNKSCLLVIYLLAKQGKVIPLIEHGALRTYMALRTRTCGQNFRSIFHDVSQTSQGHSLTGLWRDAR